MHNKYIIEPNGVESARFIKEKAMIQVILPYYHKFTIPMLEACGSVTLVEKANDTPNGKLYRVILPEGSKKEQLVTELAHVRKFPDQSVFYELYHLSISYSTVSPPF